MRTSPIDNVKEAGVGRMLMRLPMAIGKNIPLGIGTALSALSAGTRLAGGDTLGAAIDAGAGVTSFIPGGQPISGTLTAVGMIRDLLGDSNKEKNKDEEEAEIPMKTAANQFKQDIADPQAGLDSDFYSAVSPVISSESDDNLTGHDAARVKDLKEQVRKGIVGMQYLTGSKKNTGETFYDEHPTQAAATDLLGNSVPIGAAVAGGLTLDNIARQIRNMHKTEPGGMSRDKNEKDPFSPGRLLRESSGRPDVTRLFGDLENNPELRLSIYDKLNGEGSNFVQQHRANQQMKDELTAKHQQRISELQSHIEANPQHVEKLNSMMKAHADSHAREIAKLDASSKALFAQAERSTGAAHLDKYVNLHESLRAAKEKGGLKALHGEGLSHLGGVKDLLERRHITGAHPGFNEELIQNILRNHTGSHAMDSEWQHFASKHLAELADPTHQSSGIRKFLSRLKGPGLAGGATAAGGYGLYKLLKMLQEQNYSSDKINNWKKTLLQSEGDFDRADKYDKENQQ